MKCILVFNRKLNTMCIRVLLVMVMVRGNLSAHY